MGSNSNHLTQPSHTEEVTNTELEGLLQAEAPLTGDYYETGQKILPYSVN
jgi:hypothetical protein